MKRVEWSTHNYTIFKYSINLYGTIFRTQDIKELFRIPPQQVKYILFVISENYLNVVWEVRLHIVDQITNYLHKNLRYVKVLLLSGSNSFFQIKIKGISPI